jgi:hypothetical protein
MPLSTIFQLYCGRGTYKGFLGLCHFQQYFSYIVAEEHIRGFWVYVESGINPKTSYMFLCHNITEILLKVA